MDTRPTVAVLGATGAQGGSVAAALLKHGTFRVRALTRDPERARNLGDEVAAADLTQPESLAGAFDGAYAVFANTNSFAAPDTDEVAQGAAAVEAARRAGVEHYVWSTLPDVATISAGRYSVPHFTNKAQVNAVVAEANFRYHTFVEPPFYFQNLTSPMYPTPPGPDGTPTLSVPMRAESRGVHMGDITEYGSVVAGALEQPQVVGGGEVLSFAGDLLSWQDVVETLRRQGHALDFVQASDDPWGFRDMFGFFEEYTYFGPEADKKIARARDVATL